MEKSSKKVVTTKTSGTYRSSTVSSRPFGGTRMNLSTIISIIAIVISVIAIFINARTIWKMWKRHKELEQNE